MAASSPRGKSDDGTDGDGAPGVKFYIGNVEDAVTMNSTASTPREDGPPDDWPFDDGGDGLAGVPFDAVAVEEGVAADGPRSRLGKRRRNLMIAAALILVLSGTIVAIVLGRNGDKGEGALDVYGGGDIGSGGGGPSEDGADSDGGEPSRGGEEPAPDEKEDDDGRCGENFELFSIRHDGEPGRQPPNLFSQQEEREDAPIRYTWSLLGGCSRDVIARCRPCPEGDRPAAAVQLKQAMNNEGGGNNNNNLFQKEETLGRGFVMIECLPSDDSGYILEIKPMEAGESSSCCGLSDPAPSSFAAAYGGDTVAVIRDGILEVGTGGYPNDVLVDSGRSDPSTTIFHYAMTPSACEMLPGERCKRTAGCDYLDECTSITGVACRYLSRNECEESASCRFDGEDDSCSLPSDAGGDVDAGTSGGGLARGWSIRFGGGGGSCEGGAVDNDAAEEDENSIDSGEGEGVDDDTMIPKPGDGPSPGPTLAPIGRVVETTQPVKSDTGKPTREPKPTNSPSPGPTPVPSERVVETTQPVKPTREPSPAPTPFPSAQPTTRLPTTPSPTRRPIDSSPAMSCPSTGSPWIPLPSDTRIRFLHAPKDAYCGIFVERGGEGGSLIPFARSYNGGEWEASPGPYASPSGGIDCGVAPHSRLGDSDDLECAIVLPALEVDADDRYVMFSKEGKMAERKQIARFLEMTTFGPRREEIESLFSGGAWGLELRARYVREQMDAPITSHREYFRRRANAKFDAATEMARGDHPCSPGSLWRRYTFVEGDARNGDGSYARIAFEVAEGEGGAVARIYEADGPDVVSDCGSCRFRNESKGSSGAGYYSFGPSGDFVEWTVDAEETGSAPVSFRFSVGKAKNLGRRPLDLYANDVLVKRNYMFGYTDGWSSWHYSDLVDVPLKAGSNKIRLLLVGEDGPNVDHLRVGGPPAVVITSNGHPRTVVRTGVHPAGRWTPGDDVYGAAFWFPKYPEPPHGRLVRTRYGRLRVAPVSEDNGFVLDIGNPPVNFAGYEDRLAGPYLRFSESDVFGDTASQLHEYVIHSGQELLLRNGSADPMCETLPEFVDEDDPPVFGVLPDGEWLQWTPRVLLEQNGPSVNAARDELAEYTLDDGLGAAKRRAGVGCANTPRSPFNEGTCFLSDSEDACSPVVTDSDAQISLDSTAIASLNNVGHYVYAVRGLVLEDLEQHPCLAGKSRWTIQKGECPDPTPIDDPQDPSRSIALATYEALKARIKSDSSDGKGLIIDAIGTETNKRCDPKDVAVDKLRLRIVVGNFCYAHVHPEHLSVYDFSNFAKRHPGGEYNIRKWASNWDGNEGWYLDFPNQGVAGRTVPQHQMDFWENNRRHLSHVGRFGDDISYSDLPAGLKTESVMLHFGIEEKAPGGGTVVCGSVGEVANDPSLGEVFAAGSEEEVTTPTEILNNQKQVVWTEVNLYAKDQLRQRVAWALAQMITTVPSDLEGEYKTEKFVAFYDIFVRHAFGSFLDILREISYSPIMAEQLSYLNSRSHAFVYSRKDRKITKADENFARELMQLFTIGLLRLNNDGTPQLDPDTGTPLETYTNDDIESMARAWTGFTQAPARGNIEGGTGQSELDPLQIIASWRDAFPKHDLDKGYIGDRYPLCQDLLPRSFLRKGARYRLLGGSPSPQLITDPTFFADDANNILRAVLDESSELYEALHNGGNYEVAVELAKDLSCHGMECQVDTLRVVKVGTVYYEFVQAACVQMAFFQGGKKIQLRDSSRNKGQLCANSALANARESCCRKELPEEVMEATMEAGVTYMFDGERMTYETAKIRCAGIGKDVCTFRTVVTSPVDDDSKKGWHWTDQDCAILMKVNSDGRVAIVHEIDQSNARALPLHVRDTSLNYFWAFWDNESNFPGSSLENNCEFNKCQTLSDGNCLCRTNVVESAVFDDIRSISKAGIMSQLFIGAPGPPIGSIPSAGDDFTAHILGNNINESTVFEVQDKGRRFSLKNVLSTVSLGKGWDMVTIFKAEDATVVNAEMKGNENSFVGLGGDQSSIEWTVDVESSRTYSLSFKYALHANPTPLRVFINGIEIIRNPKNPTIGAINMGRAPTLEQTPLGRCEGNCKNVVCEDGLFCVRINANQLDREVPGCNMDSARAGWDYCADPLDYTHALLLPPTGSWTRDWRFSDPIEAPLVAGLNTIRVEVPRHQRNGANIAFLRIEAEAESPNPPIASFRNPPQFMSLIDDASLSGSGEKTVRDAQYETEAVLQHLFYQVNQVAPFLCTRLAQRFGHSHPSPRYVSQCSNAFRSGSYHAGSISFGSGDYGSLEATVASILLDKEANDPALMSDPSSGSIREPIVKVLSLMRSMEYKTDIPNTRDGPQMSKDFQVRLWRIEKSIGQGPYMFPSIFSFLLPEYVADTGPATSAGLLSPESELATMPNTLSLLSGMYSLIRFGLSDCDGGFSTDPGIGRCPDNDGYNNSYGRLSFQPNGATHAEEAEDLALLLTAGRLTDKNLALVVDACTSQSNKASRTSCMQQLLVSTGEFHSTNHVSQSDGERSANIAIDLESSEPYKAIVYLYMAGGVDSYNMLAPHTCAPVDVYENYRKIRGKTNSEDGVGIPLKRLLEIEANNPNQPCSSFGIHEELSVLKELYDDGQLAFIANAGLLAKPVTTRDYRDGTPVQLFSHNGMSVETKKGDIADEYRGTGVGGRLGDVLRQAGIPTDAFSIRGQQIVLLGEPGGPTPYTLNKKGIGKFYKDSSVITTERIKSLNTATTSDSGFFAEIYSSKLTDAIDKHQLLRSKLSSAKPPSTDFPSSDIADQLKMVTKLMQTAPSRGAKRDIFYVNDRGYDTHSYVDKNLSNLFSKLNPALGAFVKELKILNLWDSTVLVQFSEFGRTLEPNTGDGTDHAWAGHHFLFGGSVRGGRVLGLYPDNFEQSMSNPIALKRGRMIPTHPWDSMWKGVAEWMGVPANSPDMDKVLPMHKNFPSQVLYGKEELFQAR